MIKEYKLIKIRYTNKKKEENIDKILKTHISKNSHATIPYYERLANLILNLAN